MRHLILLHPLREPAVTTPDHLSTDDVAAFVDRTMPEHERAETERHLAECDACREEVASVARLVADAPARATHRAPWTVLIPLAAAVLVVVVWRGRADPIDAPRSHERSAPSDESRITIVAPTPDAPLTHAARTLTWHPIDGSMGYRVVIKDASGALVWRTDVPAADTSVRVPESSDLRTGVSYTWRVDGQRGDGSSAASAETSFSVSP